MSAVLKNSTPVQTPIVAAIPHLSAVPASAPEVVTIHSTIRYATYAEFFRSKLNVRRNNGSDVEGNSDFEELVALIGANGVLQNLIAYEDLIKDVLSGRKAVVAGGRRLAAVGVAIARGLLPDDYMIPYLVVTEDEAVQVSLAENSGRKDMHPADVADAMLELHKRGVSVADIALSFGVEEIAVRRRLKLANVSPNLFALYREDKLSLDCMQAFALTDDHEKQEMAFKALTKIYRLYPHDIRRMLTETKISFVHHPVARYVTVETFEKAGGMVERDLFANNAEGFTDDAALVEKLAHEKLKRKAEKVKQEGAAWVEVHVRREDVDTSRYAHIRTVRRAPTDDEQAEIDSIKARLVEIEAECDKLDEDSEEYDNLADEESDLQRKLDTIRRGLLGHHEGDKALAGAIVTIDPQGNAQVISGLIRPEDKPKMEQIGAAPKAEGSTGEDDDKDAGLGIVVAPEKTKSVHSDRLTNILTSHRTIALQAEMIQRPDVALAVATHALMCKAFGTELRIYSSRTLCGISETQPMLPDEVDASPAKAALDTKRAELLAMLPVEVNEASLLMWLLEQPQALVLDFLAYCTARSIDAKLQRESDKSENFVQLAQAVKLDMTKWWTPNGDTYFNHVSKDRIAAVVTEAKSVQAAAPLVKMKKAEAVAAATEAVAGTGWLPEMLRTA